MARRQRQDITAVIYDKKGRVLSIGQNSYIKTHPLQAKHAAKMGNEHAIYLHAEIHAITKCQDIQKAYRILVTRYDKHGNAVMAKPCPICESAIKATPIQVVQHT